MKRERGDYMTRAYFLVKETLVKAGGAHMRAEEIREELSSHGETVGLSTVYRHLSRLEREGAVRKMHTDELGSCYSYISQSCADHYHMVCTVCGRLSHLSCDHVEALFHHIRSEHGFLIDPGKTTLYGLCAVCHRKQKRKESL